MKNYPNVIVPKHGRGYFGIGIYGPKMTKNIGTLWRTADIFGAESDKFRIFPLTLPDIT